MTTSERVCRTSGQEATTEEEANVVEAQSWSWDAPSATGQESSLRRARGGADLDETRQELGIAWRADSRMACVAAWRAGRY